MTSQQQTRPDPRATRLVVVDMQEAFRAPGSQWSVPRYAGAQDHVAELAERFRGRTVWTRFVRDPAEEGAWSDYYDRWSTFRVEQESPVWDLTLPVGDDPVLTLPTFSKWGPHLTDLVGVDSRLVVCGVATDCCVLSTVLGAVDAGRSVTVVTDACAGATDEAHDQALALMGLLSPMVTLATTAEVLESEAVVA